MTKDELAEVKADLKTVKEVRVKATGVNVWVKVTKAVALGVVNSVKANQRVWVNKNFHNHTGYLVVN